jgi:hypothetical protein
MDIVECEVKVQAFLRLVRRYYLQRALRQHPAVKLAEDALRRRRDVAASAVDEVAVHVQRRVSARWARVLVLQQQRHRCEDHGI